jgi:hypothetical protein
MNTERDRNEMEKETAVLRTKRTKEKNKEILTTGRKKTKLGLVHCCRKKGQNPDGASVVRLFLAH